MRNRARGGFGVEEQMEEYSGVINPSLGRDPSLAGVIGVW
jgi:hypothetical protein